MSFYLFIAISFYLNIVCKNIVCELGLTQIVVASLLRQPNMRLTCPWKVLDDDDDDDDDSSSSPASSS